MFGRNASSISNGWVRGGQHQFSRMLNSKTLCSVLLDIYKSEFFNLQFFYLLLLFIHFFYYYYLDMWVYFHPKINKWVNKYRQEDVLRPHQFLWASILSFSLAGVSPQGSLISDMETFHIDSKTSTSIKRLSWAL